jgi:hypothetical protein
MFSLLISTINNSLEIQGVTNNTKGILKDDKWMAWW